MRNNNQDNYFQKGDYKTLPLCVKFGRAKENIKPFGGSGEAETMYVDPEYSFPSYSIKNDWFEKVNNDSNAAITATQEWQYHVIKYLYYIQIKDDPDRIRIRRLHDHTELISTLCDLRLGMDSAEMWDDFHFAMRFEVAQREYREDINRENNYAEYAQRLQNVWKNHSGHQPFSDQLIKRIIRQIQVRSGTWRDNSPIKKSGETNLQSNTLQKMLVFFCYSHEDESLRNELEKHLAQLRREKLIDEWHDRRISAGKEWEDEINEYLEKAQIILLLISSDFIASDYCHEVEMKRAMERHEEKTTRVIPVILRPCDWGNLLFGKLQALPKDADAVMLWKNRDEAFKDVAIGIRKAIEEMRGSI